MAAASGTLQGDTVLVADEKEANTLYNKGAFGVPQSGGSLALDLVEALYLVEHNRLNVKRHDAASLLRHASQRSPEFEIRYIVYRDLRARSFVVKPSNVSDWNVYARGALPGRAASTHLVRSISERGRLDVAAVLEEQARVARLGKKLLLAVVDEEGDLTYFEATRADLSSDVAALPASRARAHLLEDRVVALDAGEATKLFADGYFGRDIGFGLQLSLPEALYLAEAGLLDVRAADDVARIEPAALRERAEKLEPEFALRYALYRALRREGVVVKTGFKYGTHFRAYTGPPDEEHAPYLVHAVPPGRALPWQEVAGFVRLAHGVRKRLFFAAPTGEDGFALLELSRRKP